MYFVEKIKTGGSALKSGCRSISIYPSIRNNVHGSANLHFVIPSEPGFPATLHWTQPRVRFSVGENRMKSANAIKINRKSGEAEGPAVRLDAKQRPYQVSSQVLTERFVRPKQLSQRSDEAKMAFVWRQGAQQVPRLPRISC